MFIGVLVMSVGMVGLFSVPVGMAMSANLPWVIAFFVLATTGFTMVAIRYGAQSDEIAQNPKERSAMTGWRMAFASFCILIGGAGIPGLAWPMGYAIAALTATPLIVGAF
ncbi:MAG: GPH family glycoside/pentoside/hexuronide:cation symporter [Yoonia sp.]|jgi:GPH family glycoside/pentoside/hexuronide:cation symporter